MTPPAAARARTITLEDRWSEQTPDALMSGVQAIVRALLDQRRDDLRNGIASGGFVSGYPGSPLGGLDKELWRRAAHLRELGIVFAPGVNEELAATAVWGSQLAHLRAGARVPGVLGMWFGKSPGLDRAADALRHANISGVGPSSGAVAVVGDDPGSKSSTLPSSSERTLSGLMMPVLAPTSVQDVLDLGRHALRLSRAAGLWCALTVVADVADASAVIAHAGPLGPVQRLVDHTPTAHLLGTPSVEVERSLVEARLPATLRYAREHQLNRAVQSGERDEIGLIAAGSAYAELRRALDDLGLDEGRLSALGVRLIKLGMPWPIDHAAIRELARGLRTVFVIERKQPMLQTEVQAALYGLPTPPQVLGKQDGRGEPLLPAYGTLSADQIALALGRVLGDRLGEQTQAAQRLRRLSQRRAPAPPSVVRTPFFCSGCPHSTSTVASPDALVGAGIGCHVMLVQEQAGTGSGNRGGQIVGLTQMGGEGSQWIGISPFVTAEHFIQNIGDGTFHHSGSLALRAAVAAKVNITYKLLYNDAVAMTGGQQVEGMLSVSQLTRMLKAEGVARIAVTTEEPRRYRRTRLALGTKVHDRDKLAQVERELTGVPGVTVIIHDQMCATELRRLRRRGKLPQPSRCAWINERVCEGCGDCAQASGCLSVEPVQTQFGLKTRIHQASCNTDMSCLHGDCPSFLTVVPARDAHRTRQAPDDLPTPMVKVGAASTIRMVGIGGTGVVTVSQVLAMAAHLEGAPVSVLDQTGLSQKAGPVVSDVRLGTSATAEAAPRATGETVDVLLGFDLLGAADPRLSDACDPRRTVAVISVSESQTGEMVLDGQTRFPDRGELLARIELASASMPVLADTRLISECAFGDDLQANMVLVGAAWQLGLLGVGWEALRRAIDLNGVAVEQNLMALQWGRAVVAAPAAVRQLLGEPDAQAEPSAWAQEQVSSRLPQPVRELAALRADDLRAYGGRRVARRYLEQLERVAAAEAQRAPGRTELTETVARQLHKLLAYKDEYEVARLHLLPQERERREREFGQGAKWWLHLHPPLLRAMGLSHKIRLGRWSLPLLHALRAGRRLRGTPLDPFGYAQVRRVERALPDEYLALLWQAIERLDERTHPQVVAIGEQAQQIRGYEQIKLANVQLWRASSTVLVEQLRDTEHDAKFST
ncbi:MAG: indolepyruvate ferredoxin oxidoreductase family protein [Solirubrobacteraceae bacterium]